MPNRLLLEESLEGSKTLQRLIGPTIGSDVVTTDTLHGGDGFDLGDDAGTPIDDGTEDIEGEALATLVVNRLRGSLKVAAVKAPGFGDRRKEMLQDIAILTGGTVISEERGFKLDAADITMLGRAEKVTIDKDNTTIVGGKGAKKDILKCAINGCIPVTIVENGISIKHVNLSGRYIVVSSKINSIKFTKFCQQNIKILKFSSTSLHC